MQYPEHQSLTWRNRTGISRVLFFVLAVAEDIVEKRRSREKKRPEQELNVHENEGKMRGESQTRYEKGIGDMRVEVAVVVLLLLPVSFLINAGQLRLERSPSLLEAPVPDCGSRGILGRLP